MPANFCPLTLGMLCVCLWQELLIFTWLPYIHEFVIESGICFVLAIRFLRGCMGRGSSVVGKPLFVLKREDKSKNETPIREVALQSICWCCVLLPLQRRCQSVGVCHIVFGVVGLHYYNNRRFKLLRMTDCSRFPTFWGGNFTNFLPSFCLEIKDVTYLT